MVKIWLYEFHFDLQQTNLQSAPNIDCGYLLEPPQRGSSNEYPQYMFLIRNKKINVYSCITQFLLYKSGVEGGQHYMGVFS